MKCQGCDKEAIGYKWCAACRNDRTREANRKSNSARRAKLRTPCIECKTTMTQTKYCSVCAQLVRTRKLGEYKRKAVTKEIVKGEINPKWLKRGDIK